MSTNKDDTLRQFCDVTGADEERSKFFLESSNWQLEVALSSFYENGGNVDEAPSLAPATGPASAPVMSDSDMESPPATPLRTQKKEKKKSNTKFATLESLQNESSSDEEEVFSPAYLLDRVKAIIARFSAPSTSNTCNDVIRDKEIEIHELRTKFEKHLNENNKLKHRMAERIQQLIKENDGLRLEIARLKDESDKERLGDDEGQAFYAGGSERSGQQILGPGKGRKDIVTEMFKSVRERGAVVFEDSPSSTSRGRGAFAGVGYRLGQTNDDHEQVSPAGNDSQQSGARSVRLCLYREGFTVDGGALRHYADPTHAHFLNCIRQGEIPPELSDGGAEVRVSLEDRRHEACPRQHAARGAAFAGTGHMLGSEIPPELSDGGAEVRVSLEDRRHEACPRQHAAHGAAFAGTGHMLGSPTPPTVGATATVPLDAQDRAANRRAAQEAVAVQPGHPATTLQFRLVDGTVLTGQFNLTHTVGDLHSYICRAEPSYSTRSFILSTTYPRAELEDHTLTIESGKLANSTLMQRLK